MSTLAAKHNVGLDLSHKVAVVVGGTQGIGAATAIRFAQAGAGVYIVGRNPSLGNSVVEELKKVGKEGETFEFIQADLSLVSNVKEVVTKLQQKTGEKGVNYLVQTQGGPPMGPEALTSEGHEKHFAVQILSRFGISHLLAKSGTLKESYVTVCAPSGSKGTPPPVDDLQLKDALVGKGWMASVMAMGNRDSNTTDALISQFNETYPNLSAYHVFPGIVTTQAPVNAGLPYLVVLGWKFFSPILSRTIGNSPTSYAEIPVFIAANPKSKEMGLEFSGPKLEKLEPKWVKEQPDLRKKVWERLIEIGDF